MTFCPSDIFFFLTFSLQVLKAEPRSPRLTPHFTYRIQQYCRKGSSSAVTHQRVLLDAVLAEVPLNLFGPFYSFPSGVWEHEELTARHAQPKGIFFIPGLQQSMPVQTYLGAFGSFDEICADACDRSRSPTWKIDFQNVKVGAAGFLFKFWAINDTTMWYLVTTVSSDEVVK